MQTKEVRLSNSVFDDTAGSVTALFAPFNVIDKQNDLTLPGAFGEQNVILGAYGHRSWDGALPVGKGRIFESAEGGILEGEFNLDSIAGRETYLTVKHLGDLQEWSYALDKVESTMQTIDGKTVRVLSKITVPEVSPVLMGAAIGSRTLEIKRSCGECGDRCARLRGLPCCEGDWETQFLGGSAVEREVSRFAELCKSSERFPYVSVSDREVLPAVAIAAGNAFQKCLAFLDLPSTVTMQFVRRTADLKEELDGGASGRKLYLMKRSLAGWTRDGSDTIFVDADLEPREAAIVAVHELRHLCQRLDVHPALQELDARDFAEAFVSEHVDYGRW